MKTCAFLIEQGRKRPLDTPKREKREEREKERERKKKERYREGGRDKRDR